ncbi:hemerythrin domain-containing protein [Legionella sp. WA2022007384]
MDIYEYLKMDHDHVAHLFDQFEQSELPTRRKQIVALIAQELLIHAHSEQETFYKALKHYDLTKEEATHGKKEHKEIENQIKLILHSTEYGAPWVNKVNKLKRIVEHHVSEEEGTIFDKAKKVLSREEAYDIKEQMHYLKQQLFLSLQEKERSKKSTTIKKTDNKKMHYKKVLKKDESRTRIH